MKKVLSTILALAMLVTLFVPMTAFAAIDTITLPTTPGEFVLLEAEDYADQYYKGGTQVTYEASDQTFDTNGVATEENYFSGGKGVYSGYTGNELITLTFPVTVEQDTIFELETVAGCAGHLNQNYWTLDNNVILYTQHSIGTALNWRFTKEAHYPAGIYTVKFLVTAGTHNLTYNLPKRTNQAGAFALDYVKLTATDEVVPSVYWEEGANTSVKVNGKTVAITFDDAAVEEIGGEVSAINKYIIEIYPKDMDGAVAVTTYTFDAYTGDRKDADGNPVGRPPQYTAHVPMTNLIGGNFYAKIYPQSNLFPVMKGEVLETESFTIAEKVVDYVDRYELEDYWNIDTGDKKVVADSVYASGGKLIASMQSGAWVKNYSCLSDKEAEWWQDTFDFTFDVEIPKDGVYDIETVMGKNEDVYVDVIAVSVDGEEIYTNALANSSETVSIDGTYPWRYLYACRYNAEKELSAGTHTVTFSIARPAVEAQPHLFALDYIQFTPVKAQISQKYDTVFEMEDYADKFFAFDEAGNTEDIAPSVLYSVNASEGAFITKDYTPAMGNYPVKTEIPVTVQEAGYYMVEAMDSYAGCDGLVFLTDKDGNVTTVINNFSSGATLAKNGSGRDSADPYRANYWTYYNIKWHGARLSSKMVYLEAGDYTLTVQYNNRQTGPGMSGMAFCIDYVKVAPFVAPKATVFAEGETLVEVEDYVEYFMKDGSTASAAAIKEHESASGGMLATKTEAPMKTGHTLTVPVVAEKAGWYDMNSVISLQNGGWTSYVEITVNGNRILDNAKEHALEDLSEPLGEKTYAFLNDSYRMQRFGGLVYLNEGENELVLFAHPRTNKTDSEKADDEKLAAEGKEPQLYRVCYYIDYISFAPVTESVTVADNVIGTVVYDEAVSGQVVAAAYSGKKLVGIQVIDMNNETMANLDIVYTEQPDTVKVMAWSDLTKLDPVITAKEFTFNK